MRPAADNLLGELGLDASTSLPLLIANRVAATPRRTFLRWQERSWSYSNALEQACAWAQWLADRKIGEGRQVSVYARNRPDLVWIWMACALSGAIYAPLNREQVGAMLESQVRRLRPDLIITDSPGSFSFASGIASVSIEEAAADIGTRPSPGEPRRAAPGDTAARFLTSGTTGPSKIVEVPHNQICRGAANVAAAFGLRGDDVFHGWLPLYHIAGILHMMTTMMLVGGTVALQGGFSSSGFWRQVATDRCTVFGGFSNILHYLCSQDGPEPGGHSLRIGMFSAVPPALARRFGDRFGIPVWDSYDMSEASPVTLPDLSREAPPGSCGRPSPDLEVTIRDRGDRELASGGVGEICLRPLRPHVIFKGYRGAAEATVKSWRNLWFHTGDLGFVDGAGFVHHAGRKKDFVRRGGENVSLAELEEVIGRHDAVADCACIGLPAETDDDEIKAVIVLREGREDTPAALHDYCRNQLARFAVPRFIELRTSLERVGVGKVDRESLRSPLGPLWDANRPAG